MRLFSLITFCLFSSCIMYGQIGAKKHAGVISGLWMNDGGTEKLVLHPQGTGEFRGVEIKFATHGDRLHITGSKVTTNYFFKLQGDVLILSGGDLDKPITFRKQKPISSGLTTHETSEHEIPKALLGIWSGYNEIIEFKPDAKCVYRGKLWPYTVEDSVITMQTPQGNFIMKYLITGDRLRLRFYGADHFYNRQEEDVASEEVHVLDTTLIGRWCYGHVSTGTSQSDSECFQLNEDGTYIYIAESSKRNAQGELTRTSDTGKWWSEGTQFYLNSTNQGKVAYTLKKVNHPKTGDAMIVLNGKNYISYDRRAPW